MQLCSRVLRLPLILSQMKQKIFLKDYIEQFPYQILILVAFISFMNLPLKVSEAFSISILHSVFALYIIFKNSFINNIIYNLFLIKMYISNITKAFLKRGFSTEVKSKFTPLTLPNLNYDYSELEPVISTQLLQKHHKKHHQAYINNYNNAIQQFNLALQNHDYNKLAALTQTIKFNLGGHINHSVYWENLSPISKNGGQYPGQESQFTQQVKRQFDSYQNLIEQFTKKTIPIQGSGWGWLAYDALAKSLRILELPNQEMLAPAGLTPLLTIDVWQHAYYIDYKNQRAEYVKQIWKIVNWKDAQRRFLNVTNKK